MWDFHLCLHLDQSYLFSNLTLYNCKLYLKTFFQSWYQSMSRFHQQLLYPKQLQICRSLHIYESNHQQSRGNHISNIVNHYNLCNEGSFMNTYNIGCLLNPSNNFKHIRCNLVSQLLQLLLCYIWYT